MFRKLLLIKGGQFTNKVNAIILVADILQLLNSSFIIKLPADTDNHILSTLHFNRDEERCSCFYVLLKCSLNSKLLV